MTENEKKNQEQFAHGISIKMNMSIRSEIAEQPLYGRHMRRPHGEHVFTFYRKCE